MKANRVVGSVNEYLDKIIALIANAKAKAPALPTLPVSVFSEQRSVRELQELDVQGGLRRTTLRPDYSDTIKGSIPIKTDSVSYRILPDGGTVYGSGHRVVVGYPSTARWTSGSGHVYPGAAVEVEVLLNTPVPINAVDLGFLPEHGLGVVEFWYETDTGWYSIPLLDNLPGQLFSSALSRRFKYIVSSPVGLYYTGKDPSLFQQYLHVFYMSTPKFYSVEGPFEKTVDLVTYGSPDHPLLGVSAEVEEKSEATIFEKTHQKYAVFSEPAGGMEDISFVIDPAELYSLDGSRDLGIPLLPGTYFIRADKGGWADNSRLWSKGFWLTVNGEQLPPNPAVHKDPTHSFETIEITVTRAQEVKLGLRERPLFSLPIRLTIISDADEKLKGVYRAGDWVEIPVENTGSIPERNTSIPESNWANVDSVFLTLESAGDASVAWVYGYNGTRWDYLQELQVGSRQTFQVFVNAWVRKLRVFFPPHPYGPARWQSPSGYSRFVVERDSVLEVGPRVEAGTIVTVNTNEYRTVRTWGMGTSEVERLYPEPPILGEGEAWINPYSYVKRTANGLIVKDSYYYSEERESNSWFDQTRNLLITQPNGYTFVDGPGYENQVVDVWVKYADNYWQTGYVSNDDPAQITIANPDYGFSAFTEKVYILDGPLKGEWEITVIDFGTDEIVFSIPTTSSVGTVKVVPYPDYPGIGIGYVPAREWNAGIPHGASFGWGAFIRPNEVSGTSGSFAIGDEYIHLRQIRQNDTLKVYANVGGEWKEMSSATGLTFPVVDDPGFRISLEGVYLHKIAVYQMGADEFLSSPDLLFEAGEPTDRKLIVSTVANVKDHPNHAWGYEQSIQPSIAINTKGSRQDLWAAFLPETEVNGRLVAPNTRNPLTSVGYWSGEVLGNLVPVSGTPAVEVDGWTSDAGVSISASPDYPTDGGCAEVNVVYGTAPSIGTAMFMSSPTSWVGVDIGYFPASVGYYSYEGASLGSINNVNLIYRVRTSEGGRSYVFAENPLAGDGRYRILFRDGEITVSRYHEDIEKWVPKLRFFTTTGVGTELSSGLHGYTTDDPEDHVSIVVKMGRVAVSVDADTQSWISEILQYPADDHDIAVFDANSNPLVAGDGWTEESSLPWIMPGNLLGYTKDYYDIGVLSGGVWTPQTGNPDIELEQGRLHWVRERNTLNSSETHSTLVLPTYGVWPGAEEPSYTNKVSNILQVFDLNSSRLLTRTKSDSGWDIEPVYVELPAGTTIYSTGKGVSLYTLPPRKTGLVEARVVLDGAPAIRKTETKYYLMTREGDRFEEKAIMPYPQVTTRGYSVITSVNETDERVGVFEPSSFTPNGDLFVDDRLLRSAGPTLDFEHTAGGFKVLSPGINEVRGMWVPDTENGTGLPWLVNLDTRWRRRSFTINTQDLLQVKLPAPVYPPRDTLYSGSHPRVQTRPGVWKVRGWDMSVMSISLDGREIPDITDYYTWREPGSPQGLVAWTDGVYLNFSKPVSGTVYVSYPTLPTQATLRAKITAFPGLVESWPRFTVRHATVTYRRAVHL